MADPVIQPQDLRPAARPLSGQLDQSPDNPKRHPESLPLPRTAPISVIDVDRLQISRSAIEAVQISQAPHRLNPMTENRSPEWVSAEDLTGLPSNQVKRIQDQVSRLQQILAGFDKSTSPQSDMRLLPSSIRTGDKSTRWNPAESSDETIREYLALIRTLMKDDKTLNAFLNSFEQFLSQGESQNNSAVSETRGRMDAVSGLDQSAQVTEFFSSLQVHFEMETVDTASSHDRTTQQTTQDQQITEGVSDPLVLDLDGDGIELTSAHSGARFDITGDGGTEKTAFATGDDAFLALDKNRNGKIDGGRELFGDQNGAANGFEELSKYDSNQDGIIDHHDGVYDRLVLFTDRDRRLQGGKLRTLAEAGIANISLAYRNTSRYTSGGNRVSQVALFTRFDGRQNTAADALLNYVA